MSIKQEKKEEVIVHNKIHLRNAKIAGLKSEDVETKVEGEDATETETTTEGKVTSKRGKSVVK